MRGFSAEFFKKTRGEGGIEDGREAAVSSEKASDWQPSRDRTSITGRI